MPLYGRRQSKPNPGVGIDWGHPLAQGLLAFWPLSEGAGATVHDSAGRGGVDMAAEGTPAWTPAASGPGLSVVASGAGAFAILPPSLRVSYPITILCGFVYLGGTPSANAGIFGLVSTTSGAGVVNNARISWDGTAATIGWSGSGLAASNGTGYSPTAGAEIVYGLTLTPGPVASFYVAGQPTSTTPNGTGGAATWTATSNASIGQIPGLSSRTPKGVVTWAAALSRALSAAEHAAWAANPWQVFSPPAYRLFGPAAAAAYQPWIYGDQIESNGMG